MKRTILFAMAFAVAGLGAANAANATPWASHHPRRAEVNGRLNNQFRRIRTERRDGELTGRRAAYLHAEDRGIRAQERFDASRDGGHITRAEQAQMNHEENRTSRQINY
jgi:hypothetical protein